MPTVNMHEAKTQLSRLVELALQGELIVIARNGKPLVRLVPVKQGLAPRRLGSMEGQIIISDDFDDPLPEDLLRLFEGAEE